MIDVILTEVFDEHQKMVRIQASATSGEHQLDILWDPTDEDTPENRAAFRKWAITMLNRKGLNPIN